MNEKSRSPADYAIYMIELDGTVSSWNAGAERMKGFRADEIVGRNFAAFYTDHDIARGEPERTLAVARQRSTFAGEGWRIRKDGSRFWASVVVDALHDAGGRLVGYAKVTHDVTERTIEEERRQIIVDAAPNGMLVVDAAGLVTFANARAEHILGAPAGALTGLRLESVVPLERRDDRILPVEFNHPQHFTGLRLDGRTVPLEVTVNEAPTARGHVIVASIVDITERFRAETERRGYIAELKDAERERDRLIERVTLATEAGKVGIWEWDITHDCMLWDARMNALYGLPGAAGGASYDRWTKAIHPADRTRVIAEINAAILRSKPLDTEFRVIWPAGDLHNMRAQATVVRNARDGTARMVGTHWDITEVRSLTEALREEKQRQLAYERERLYEHERKWSTTFQRAVLSPALPRVDGCSFDAVYEPGLGDAQVGGDWYDAVRLADGQILVSIGDVAGSGLEAAVVVGVVRQIIRGIAQLHTNPMLILDAADRALRLEYPDVYVTAWLGLIDLVTRTITYASAGHPPPLIVATNGTVRELGGTTLPIGLREKHQGEASTVALNTGDTLVLYTDGVTEASKDVIAGTEALIAAASTLADARFAHPAEHVRNKVIPNGSHDDVAILVLRMDLVRAEQNIDRWCFDARDAYAANSARKRFVNTLNPRQFSADDIANAELVFGELIGNVVRHAKSGFDAEIAIDHGGPRTVLHVLDRGAGFHHVSRLPPDPYAETGRGLFLVAALTGEFTVTERPDGGSHARTVLLGGARP